MFCDCLQNKTDHSDATIYLDLGKETATYISYPNLNAHLINECYKLCFIACVDTNHEYHPYLIFIVTWEFNMWDIIGWEDISLSSFGH